MNPPADTSRSGFVTIVGRPNSGKSTLVNFLVGEKVSIVTDKPQTTRNVVRGIVNRPEGQIVFLDTPGVHKPVHRMNERMMKAVRTAMSEVDIVTLIIDQQERVMAAEMIREKLILLTRDELPYSTAVAVERFEEGEALHRIYATIFVERESQKPIVIGKGGELLKQAGGAARLDLEKF